MKEKILVLIIGILIGAIIATCCFYIYTKANEATIDDMQMVQMQDFEGNRPKGEQNRMNKEDMPDDERKTEMPDEDSSNEQNDQSTKTKTKPNKERTNTEKEESENKVKTEKNSNNSTSESNI